VAMTDQEFIQTALTAASSIQEVARAVSCPPDEGFPCREQHVLPMSLVRGTRGYIEKIANQVNGCYERGWYDACLVMLRRLIETLIIEVFEAHGLARKIKNSAGDFFFLNRLIKESLAEPTWHLGRDARRALPKLKAVGDRSAHSRRFVAHRNDVEALVDDVRVAVQELLYLARLK